MTVTAIREKLHSYIDSANDKQLKNIYSLFEDQIAERWEWSEDEEFVAELNERVARYESGADRGQTWDELEAEIAERKRKRAVR